MLSSETSKKFSLLILSIAFFVFVYYTAKAIEIVNKTQVSTSDGIYTSYISTSEEIQKKAEVLTNTCVTTLCKVQKLLDYASNIPYQTQTFQKNSPLKTIQNNFGDCDDKSNLLISMLYAIGIEAYFVLVPKHIFVIVPLDDKRVAFKKGLWVNDRKYYILESTSKDSQVGFPLKYKLDEIDVIIEPFTNEKIDIQTLNYKV